MRKPRTKTIEVDFWRTMKWLQRLLDQTGLGIDALAAKLLQMLDGDRSVLDLSRQLRRYRAGEGTAWITAGGRKKTSWVILSDRIVPGCFWDFCDPFFDLLEELLLWNAPQRAEQRFHRRLRAEAAAAAYGVSPGNSARSGAFTSLERPGYENYNRLRRIRRCMLAIEDFPVSQTFWSPTPGASLIRFVGNIHCELIAVRSTPRLRDLSICLALYLEALELSDPTRFLPAQVALRLALPALDSETSLRDSASKIRELIENELASNHELAQSLQDTRVARTETCRVTLAQAAPANHAAARLLVDTEPSVSTFGTGPAASRPVAEAQQLQDLAERMHVLLAQRPRVGQLSLSRYAD